MADAPFDRSDTSGTVERRFRQVLSLGMLKIPTTICRLPGEARGEPIAISIVWLQRPEFATPKCAPIKGGKDEQSRKVTVGSL
eukprot:6172838-Pleurochrysis_carterae.AAC.3